MIRWGLVIHGGIDGFSRLVVFLQCSDNNRADTVKQAFLGAVSQYGLPSRLRCDLGGENVRVAELMIRARGENRNSVLVGPSVHNQRIERLWRDVFDVVTGSYYRVFYHLESCGILDPLNPLHLFCLHYVYLPRINSSLISFVEGWNNHPMRTCKGMSPLQQFLKGMIVLRSQGVTAHDLSTTVFSDYGEEDDDELSSIENDSTSIPKISNPLSLSDFETLQNTVNPLGLSENGGIDLYEEVLLFVLTIVQ